MAAGLDRLDIKILDVIQHDASLNSHAIGERVGLSSSPCYRRVKRMEDDGAMPRLINQVTSMASTQNT
ncbi:MAG: hypothetical protein COA43_10050 [Robiginitomaculum sp.]|nr:MAG: hypothetical protein COA43_10050 [Robiginitomaculum sp.]